MSSASILPAVEHLDVLIVGAGISGIGAGRYLKTELPSKSFAILEARAASGGTWDLFRYPGIRSDSDLHTFGYEFKPWRDEQSIADAPRILAYLRETATGNGLDDHTRYHHEVLGASWSTVEARWTVDVRRTDTGERTTLTCTWLFCAGGYYRYDEGFTPDFEGRERFRGTIVHPQAWPEDLDYAGKRVLVIGSGATAVTLVPAMTGTAAHVTMLQRTPTYVLPVPRKDAIANALKKYLGQERGYALTRRKNIAQQRAIWRFCQRYPKARAGSSGGSTPSSCPRAIRSTSTSTRRTTRGTSGCAPSRTGTCSGSSGTVRPRSSPTGSPPSPRRGCCWSPAARWRPT